MADLIAQIDNLNIISNSNCHPEDPAPYGAGDEGSRMSKVSRFALSLEILRFAQNDRKAHYG